MKRLLIFTGYFHPHIGGYEKNVLELARRLSEKGYHIDVLTDNTNNMPLEENIGDIHVYRLPCWNSLNGTYPIPKPSLAGFKIIRKLSKNKYDIINTQTRFFITSSLGLIFARIKKVPLIHTERGSRHSSVTNLVVDAFSRAYDHTLGTLLVRYAGVNIGVSNAVGEFLKHIGARNIKIIPNGIDTDYYRKTDSDFKRALGISDNTLIITFIGRLIHGKGIQDLLSVIPALKKMRPSIKLLIVGDGSYKKYLEEQTIKLGCSGEVIYLGQKEHDDIIKILSITDIFVNPSYSEGLPTSVIEAASIGLPIIATDVGGTREIIDDGKTGFLIEAKDIAQLENKLCTLIADVRMRREFGDNARKFVAQMYDWNEITRKMTQIFDELNQG